jgi:membrane protease YdiL (CAAX protease family)
MTGVVTTGLAGLGFSFLRYATGSVLAPTMFHAAVNVSGFIAARILHVDRPRKAARAAVM